MGTAIGSVIDYFVTGLTPLIAGIDQTMAVVDGWPEVEADGYLIIGRSTLENDQAADSETAWYDLGAQRIEETFTVPGYIDVVRGGPTQKPARDAAIAAFDQVVAFVRSDLTLGGRLNRGRVAIATHIHLKQTVGDDVGENGTLRRAVLGFSIACKNTY